MKSSLLVVLIGIVVTVGSTLATMNKACKSGNHAWCAPTSTIVRHHVKTRPPASKNFAQYSDDLFRKE